MAITKRTKRDYRKALTRIRWSARGALRWHDQNMSSDVGLLDEIDSLRAGIEWIEEMVTEALEGRTYSPNCLRCRRAERAAPRPFCDMCWEKVKADFREVWKDVTFKSEQEFEELALSFFVEEIDEEGE